MLSVTIITKNEETNLRRCLESVRFADEIIVLDSGSTDNTLAIAKEYTSKVYSSDWPGYGKQKQRALDYATGTWVLNLDADESVSPELKEAILAAMKKNTHDAYRIPILLNFYGKPHYYSWCPKRHIRFYKREGAHYSDRIVHEEVFLPEGVKIGKLRAPLNHHSFQDISHALAKMNHYSSYSANIRIKNKRRPSFLKTILGSWSMFFRCYVIQGGFLEGRSGFLLAVLSAQNSFYRGIKTLYPDQSRDVL